MHRIKIGAAGWSVPLPYRAAVAASHLEQYAAFFDCVEINSSFSKPHRLATYQRWAARVPADFRFSVKVPKVITHERRLSGCDDAIEGFCASVAGLREKLAVVLVQLPPSLVFDERSAEATFNRLRLATQVRIVCEARHISWFTSRVDDFLGSHSVTRVMADPPVGAPLRSQIVAKEFAYFRLHGRPRVYYSAYSPEDLRELAPLLGGTGTEAGNWCIFDNTANGAAWPNAIELKELLQREL